jgi:rhodanese-related sulfurtransferase
MVAADVLAGDMPLSHWPEALKGFRLDVRQPFELAVENVPESVNIPLPELRNRMNELPKDQTIHVFCRSGQRAYYATKMLVQNGFNAKNVSGGMMSLAQNYMFESDIT